MFEAGIFQIFGKDWLLGFAGGMVVTASLVQWIKHSVLNGVKISRWMKILLVLAIALIVALAWDIVDGTIEWAMLPSVVIIYTFSSVTLYSWVIKPMFESFKKKILNNNQSNPVETGASNEGSQ